MRLIEAERPFPVAAIWNDRLGSAPAQVFAQLGPIVGFVAEHPFRRLHSANEALCDGQSCASTSGQQDGDKAPFNICFCSPLMDEVSATMVLRFPQGDFARAVKPNNAAAVLTQIGFRERRYPWKASFSGSIILDEGQVRELLDFLTWISS